MREVKAGVPESHLQALLDFQCRTRGAQIPSFPPVVAGGARANTLHYINNTDLLKLVSYWTLTHIPEDLF